MKYSRYKSYFGYTFMGILCVILVACKLPTSSIPTPTNTVSDDNKMGINIGAPLDYQEDRLYADIIKTSRDFIAGTKEYDGVPVEIDENGWPKGDFSFYLWDKLPNMNGTYTLTFTGKADVTTSTGGPIATVYNEANNTSTGTYNQIAPVAIVALRFANTKQTNASALGTGVTNIKFMRPLTPGSNVSYPSTTLFTDPIKALISKFSVIRFMDFLTTNGSQQVRWEERPLPSWASFNRYALQKSPTSVNKYGWQGIGGPIEHAILLANETNKDMWISIPVLADDNYVQNLARLLAYGSNGKTPYTSLQLNPMYPPLKPKLKVYLEYSNEIWNGASAFPQSYTNCKMASDELAAGNSALNWDGHWNGVQYKNPLANGEWATVDNSHWDTTFCYRRAAKHTVEISNIFRGVFGDSAMITRIRPVMMSQLTNAGGMLFQESKMLLNYYNHMAGDFPNAPTAHAPSYYIYGAGGSGYYNVTTPNTLVTVDDVFNSPDMLPSGFRPELQDDTKYTVTLGVKRIAYEGGPSFDNVNPTVNAVYSQAVKDPRITTTMINMHNEWSANNGDLLVYYVAAGDHQWGFTSDIFNLNTPKMSAITSLNGSKRVPVTTGTLFPGSISGTTPDLCSRGWGCSPIQAWDNFTADDSKFAWANYSFRSKTLAPWTVTLAITNPTGAKVAVYLDGDQVEAAKDISAEGNVSFSFNSVKAGVHGITVRAVNGSFKVSTVLANSVTFSK